MDESTQIDICIICALPEEADRLKDAFQGASKNIFNDQLPVVFERRYSNNSKRNYDYTTITNAIGERLSVLVTWLAGTGLASHLHILLQEFNPRFAAMTGICVGDREKVKLGDIIIAERAFLYDRGKIVSGINGRSELLRDTDTATWSLPTEVLHFVHGFQNWKQAVRGELRPSSKRQQRDWLLNKLLDPNTPQVDTIPPQELKKHVPDWRKIVQELQGDNKDAYLTSDRILKDPARIRALYYGKDIFPFEDAKEPKVHINPVASGSTVRADNPFDEIRTPVRGTLAVEMEGAAFYRTLHDFESIHYLLVKGVCDYADKDKDDSYHDYAGKISALYMFAFLREYVTSNRFSDIKRSSSISGPSTPELSPIPKSQIGLNLFYSYASEDDKWHKELEKHLVMLMLKRGGPFKEVYANNIRAGLSNDATTYLEQAQIILLLISPDFIANDELYDKHLKKAFELQKASKARIVPILLRPTELQGTPLANMIVLPRNRSSISEWKNKDAAFYGIIREIRHVAQEFQE